MGNRLASWLTSPVGEAFKWTLAIEFAALMAEVVEKMIEGFQKHGAAFPLTTATLAEIASIQWQLIFIGLGTLIGSFVATPPSRRNTNVLLAPYLGVLIAVLTILLSYGIWPWIGPIWVRVAFTDAVGLLVLYSCVRRAARVRKL